MTATDTTPDASPIDTLTAELERLEERLTTLETELDEKDDRITQLETQLDEKDDRIAELERQLETTEARLDAHERKLNTNKARVGELQARELEKGAHLLAEHVDRTAIDVPDGRLERIRKDDGNRYLRLPESDDPLDRGGDVTLAHGDLLPIQQFARMDADMLRSATSSLPARLAANLWKARTDPTVGDDPWSRGSKSVREYVTAGDMKHWIRRQEAGISETYAKKLVSRTIDALLELSKHRLAVRKRSQRKNGLEYTERRVVLPADAEIPGETHAGTGSGPGKNTTPGDSCRPRSQVSPASE